MPVRRRAPKYKDTQPAWEMVFQSGYDFFGDLPDIGVETDDYGRPKRGDAEIAWDKFGWSYLDQYSDKYLVPWALREFGEPRRHRHAR
jgi:hypothetical protein